MAIPYLNVQFTHSSSDGGAPEKLAYLGRCQILDVRLARQFDYQHLAGDLVHSEIMLTEGSPKPSRTSSTLQTASTRPRFTASRETSTIAFGAHKMARCSSWPFRPRPR